MPEPGDVMAIHVGEAPVLILRDDDGAGARLPQRVPPPRRAARAGRASGQVGNLVCRYHTWTYGLDGAAAVRRPHGGGLRPVLPRAAAGGAALGRRVAVRLPGRRAAGRHRRDGGGDRAVPAAAPRSPRRRVARQIDLVEHGNWKLTMENNRECYHCAANHPELTVPLFAYGFGFAPGVAGRGRAGAGRALRRHGGRPACALGGGRAAVAPASSSCTGRATGYPHRAAAAGPRRAKATPRTRASPAAGCWAG